MKKSILITGKEESGKTKKAREIALQFNNDEVVYLAYNKRHQIQSFYFSACTKKTKLIIIDEIKSTEYIHEFFNYLSDGVFVNKKMQNGFMIKPKFILVCNSETPPISRSIHERFNVISL